MILRDRIEYEEWLLKALDASTAPRLLRRRTPKVAADAAKTEAGSSSQSAVVDQVRACSLPFEEASLIIPLSDPTILPQEYAADELGDQQPEKAPRPETASSQRPANEVFTSRP